jgi:hypothetical protein
MPTLTAQRLQIALPSVLSLRRKEPGLEFCKPGLGGGGVFWGSKRVEFNPYDIHLEPTEAPNNQFQVNA